MSQAVEAFRQISWLIFKWILIASGSLIGLALVIWAGICGFGWYTHDRHVPNVQFIVSTDRKECVDDKWPIHLIIGNGSERTIEKVSFAFVARRPERSTDLARYHSYSDDHIIPPQKGYGICWAAPELSEKVDDVRTLEWTIGSKSITFRD
ncbi:hypothetical protein [Bradyrhizobium sp. Arg816]|uniref:hypothetical protein n=1 Tax=Bradyrhizobium sp. Arg816 TaxID=2998491 RepID=UPI00249F32EA|nr:hypothetical protein [Bradyrhizobium sp. Arg816]MDI3560011.1 hypothetical protein [Bradyrhizobium sp. Arg816]